MNRLHLLGILRQLLDVKFDGSEQVIEKLAEDVMSGVVKVKPSYILQTLADELHARVNDDPRYITARDEQQKDKINRLIERLKASEHIQTALIKQQSKRWRFYPIFILWLVMNSIQLLILARGR